MYFAPSQTSSLLIVGLNNHKNVKVNSVLLLKPDIFVNEDGKNEYCLKAFEIRDGVETELIGYVAREFLPFKGRYEFKLAQVTELYSDSPNSQEQEVSIQRNGVCVCKLLN